MLLIGFTVSSDARSSIFHPSSVTSLSYLLANAVGAAEADIGCILTATATTATTSPAIAQTRFN
ncbi:hypothetical protein [Gordonia sp. NPDC003585]|uniref:hypothetical protein n=1 Tax=unclassified Gordonia (in: high G+C Gram-positive bacteria) TaxID=2657482 RepID=UPI0033B3C702